MPSVGGDADAVDARAADDSDSPTAFAAGAEQCERVVANE